MFLKPFTMVRTCKITASGTAQKAASSEVLTDARADSGRVALEINNIGESAVYVGDKNVTSSTGIPIAAGAYRVFPVQFNSANNIYIVGSGDVIIGEYF